MSAATRTLGVAASAATALRRPVFVVGAARSGTTWTASALARCEGAALVSEPDSPRNDPYGFRLARSLGYFPVLEPGDDAPEYERLWDGLFAARDGAPGDAAGLRSRIAMRSLRRATTAAMDRAFESHRSLTPSLRVARRLAVPRTVPASVRAPVVKSVVSAFALEWIVERWRPAVLVVQRHPLDVVASWLHLSVNPLQLDTDPRVARAFEAACGVPLPPPEPRGSGARFLAWRVGLLTSVLQARAASHPSWRTVTHGWLCEDPVARFRTVAAWMGLSWSEDVASFLAANDVPGTGYDVRRVASEQHEPWRTRLSDRQATGAREVLRAFPIDWSMFGGEPS